MIIWDYIKNSIKPPFLKRKNLGKIYSTINRVFQELNDDFVRVVKNYFPYLSSIKILHKHRQGLNIPEYAIDTEEDIRNRTATAAFYLERIGERKALIEMLESNFSGRYTIIELPKNSWRLGISRLGINTILAPEPNLYVKIQSLTSEESNMLDDFLSRFLDPDIEYHIQNKAI